ncbi:PEP-CTERM sorting domain-containing protein [Pseudoduganella violaceinigra]|uniref:PEP-CTERM sorting domain-containing protein n=1 Tax=Pseudoduganella violaceinigra TaxID=246602 RepID=UPI00068606CB|nr:PEP-CTERM sorting domain-containing protein [Pseudoduganella violaceinigra]
MIRAKHLLRLLAFFVAIEVMGLGLAQANPLSVNALLPQQSALQHSLQVDVTGIPDNDERGSASNFILDFYVGSLASITSLKWDINLTSYAGSYLSEMKITFSDTVGNGITFTPGGGDDFDGTMDYSGFQNLGDLGQIFQVGIDGILRLEFHDGYKDLAFDEPEGMWNFGTLVFGVAEVPEPPTYALILGGLLLLSNSAKRRRAKN